MYSVKDKDKNIGWRNVKTDRDSDRKKQGKTKIGTDKTETET